MYRGLIWISYDDQTSIMFKTELAFKHKLAGIMIFAIELDDFQGRCKADKYPLLRTINHVLYKLVREEFLENNNGTGTSNSNFPEATVSLD